MHVSRVYANEAAKYNNRKGHRSNIEDLFSYPSYFTYELYGLGWSSLRFSLPNTNCYLSCMAKNYSTVMNDISDFTITPAVITWPT